MTTQYGTSTRDDNLFFTESDVVVQHHLTSTMMMISLRDATDLMSCVCVSVGVYISFLLIGVIRFKSLGDCACGPPTFHTFPLVRNSIESMYFSVVRYVLFASVGLTPSVYLP